MRILPQSDNSAPRTNVPDMKKILTLYMLFLCLVTSAQTRCGDAPLSLEEIRGRMRNSYMEVKWINERFLTYIANEGDSKNYYIVDTKTWKPLKMFDNKAFADSLNKISQGGADPSDLCLGFLKFEKTDPLKFSFSYKRDNSLVSGKKS